MAAVAVHFIRVLCFDLYFGLKGGNLCPTNQDCYCRPAMNP